MSSASRIDFEPPPAVAAHNFIHAPPLYRDERVTLLCKARAQNMHAHCRMFFVEQTAVFRPGRVRMASGFSCVSVCSATEHKTLHAYPGRPSEATGGGRGRYCYAHQQSHAGAVGSSGHAQKNITQHDQLARERTVGESRHRPYSCL